MLLISVGVGFLLIFAVLISDAFSSGSARTSSTKPTAESPKTRKSDADAQSASTIERPRSTGTSRPDDGLGRAA